MKAETLRDILYQDKTLRLERWQTEFDALQDKSGLILCYLVIDLFNSQSRSCGVYLKIYYHSNTWFSFKLESGYRSENRVELERVVIINDIYVKLEQEKIFWNIEKLKEEGLQRLERRVNGIK